ncbi:MAG: hypothetical protein E5W86_02520 [Mesorhizobium sp.]|nr:MAG: hypothetical protein E5W86_02520 [Mesorhizobium sp.]TIT44733.1 MAG: hypothetical protein E5W76_01020 [Mesorhizobium sp.]
MAIRASSERHMNMKLVIHAGFGKTGSSAIQEALHVYSAALEQDGIRKIGGDLTFDQPGIPQWLVEEACERDEVLTERLGREIKRVAPSVAVLSAENLESPKKPRLLSGIDCEIDTIVVIYMRPQFQWIPSAWKQWYMKDATSLRAFVERCLTTGMPNCLESLNAWRAALPRARVIVRPLGPTLVGGGVVPDFFGLIGSSISPLDLRANEGIDYSLLHLMAKRARDLFSGYHDVELERWLLTVLPDEYKRANVPMLDLLTARSIAKRFREENVQILSDFSDIPEPAQFLDRHWCPEVNQISYLEMTDAELTSRGLAILSQIGPDVLERFARWSEK